MLLTKDGLLEQEKEQILVWINEIKSGNTGTGLFFLHFLHIAIIYLFDCSFVLLFVYLFICLFVGRLTN